MTKQPLPPQVPVGLLIAAVRRRIKQTVGDVARPMRLTPQQFWVMVGIFEREGLSLTELAERHPLDQPTASRVVAALARRRLVHVADDADDRRRSHLLLTESGRALAARLHPLAQEIRAATVAGFAPAELESLASALRRIVANLDRHAEARGRAASGAAIGGRR